MQADTYALKQILVQDRRYVIPTFQRDYEWTREGQWELLYDDLEAVADRLAEARAEALARGESITKADKRVTPHFLGAVVCDQLASRAGGLDIRAVIDGQQRLTTLQLLLRGLLDVLLERSSPRVRQVRRLLRNPDDVVNETNERHKLWPRRRDREVWAEVMADEVPQAGQHLYLQGRAYFAQRTRTAVLGPAGDDRTDAFVDALQDLFKLVVIDLEDNDDAQVIFEVLNGRQTPLSASDLVKNLLFLRGELADETELDMLYDRYWAPFDDPWWKETVGRGHATRGRRDLLLSSWLTAAAGSEVNVGHLYGEVRGYLNRSDRKTHDVLAELHAYGIAFQTAFGARPAASTRLARAYRRLDRLGMQTTVPLLLWLHLLPSEQLTLVEHERAVTAVESWVIRRMITGANTRGYGKAFVEVLQAGQAAARTTDSSIASAVIKSLDHGANSLTWPTDAELEEAFVQRRAYNTLTQERIRLVLGAIDEQLQRENPKTEPATFAYDQLQIEHVMPQDWRRHWHDDLPTEPAQQALAAQQRDQIIHRWGNLTLVTATFNQAASNVAWSSKQPELQTQSKLQLNTAPAALDTWDHRAITERARTLAAVASTVWPVAEHLG